MVPAAIVLLAMACRCLAWTFYRIQYAHDTFDYQSLAIAFKHWDFSCCPGVRTPLYAALLLLCGLQYGMVVVVQQLLGVAMVLCLYDIARRLMGRCCAIIVGCFAAVTMYSVFLEFLLLTEAVSAFLVVVSFSLYLRSAGNVSTGMLPTFLLGVVIALAALCRPNLLCLAAVYGLAIWMPMFTSGRPVKARLVRSFLLLAPVAGLVSAWCWFNALTTGQFSLSTGAGLNFFEYAGPHLQLVSDRYQPFKQIMLETVRHAGRSDATGLRPIAWHALPDIQEKTGLSYGEVSVRVGEMARDLYLRHPILYLKGVLRACIFFWTAPHCCNFEDLPLWLRPWMASVLWGQRCCLVALNAVFLCLSPCVLLRVLRQADPCPSYGVVLVLVGLGGCMSSALVKCTEIGRYALPFQPLAALASVYFIFLLVRKPSPSSSGPFLGCESRMP